MKKLIRLLFIFALTLSSGMVKAEFVFAHINESIMPIERGAKYEDPLDAYLKSKGIGEVTGGGSSLSRTGEIEWIGVDIELSSPNKNIGLVVRKLKALGAPPGSFLEYDSDGKSRKLPIK